MSTSPSPSSSVAVPVESPGSTGKAPSGSMVSSFGSRLGFLVPGVSPTRLGLRTLGSWGKVTELFSRAWVCLPAGGKAVVFVGVAMRSGRSLTGGFKALDGAHSPLRLAHAWPARARVKVFFTWTSLAVQSRLPGTCSETKSVSVCENHRRNFSIRKLLSCAFILLVAWLGQNREHGR